MAANNGAGGPRVRIVRYMECRRNHAAQTASYAVDGCRVFVHGRATQTPQAAVCATCGCHRNFHRKQELARAAAGNRRRLAAVAGVPLPPLPPRPPRPAPPQPPVAPESARPEPSNQPPNDTGSEATGLTEIEEKSKPPKKRRANFEAGEFSSTPSTGV